MLSGKTGFWWLGLRARGGQTGGVDYIWDNGLPLTFTNWDRDQPGTALQVEIRCKLTCPTMVFSFPVTKPREILLILKGASLAVAGQPIRVTLVLRQGPSHEANPQLLFLPPTRQWRWYLRRHDNSHRRWLLGRQAVLGEVQLRLREAQT